jgi:acyl-CoA thioesterase
MPTTSTASATAFDRDTAVVPRGAGAFDCELSERHWVIRGPNGGYLAALLARAGDAQVADPARQLRSLSTYYLRPPVAGPARIEATTEKDGRSVTFLRLRMIQDDRTALLATGAWATARPGLEVDTWTPPEAPPPDQCTPLARPRQIRVHAQWEIRGARTDMLAGNGAPDLVWWVRPPAHRPLDAPMLVAIADVFPPAIFGVLAEPVAVPTMDLTVHLRTELTRVRWQAGDWLLARFATRRATGGFLEEDGEIWTADGILLAQSRQLALTI